MSELLKRLLGFLFPGVDGDADDPGVGDPPVDGGGNPGEADLPGDDDLDFELVDSEPTGGKETPEQRIERLEAEAARARLLETQLEAARRGTPSTAPRTPDRTQFDEEEARLRDPNVSEDEKWRIQSNRAMRDSHRLSQQALFQAQDLNDRTAFQAKFSADPRRQKYEPRIEAELQKMRESGQNAPREALYYLMLGKDIAEGRLKPKAKPRTPAADVPRGRSPGVRSDISARGAKTEHEKRRARLENMQI